LGCTNFVGLIELLAMMEKKGKKEKKKQR